MKRSIVIAAMLGAWALGTLAVNAAAAEAPTKGARRIYRDAGGVEWCVTVIALDTGVDGRPWVWFGFEHDLRRVEHVPADVVGGACPANMSSGPVPLKSLPAPLPPAL